MTTPPPDLPKTEFAFPGPLRDQLVAAVLSGVKTSTTGLFQDHERDGEPLPAVGDRSVVVDSADRPVAVIELTEVRLVRLGDVDLDHARDEGEGYDSVAAWRAGHEAYWHGPDYRGWFGDPDFIVTDDTLAVAVRFRLLHRL
ncbi:ASCH domain-containing protein [Micromonospora purpureochromogenes]|uniref:ASCH domain-containing protein n=1 Tax=Micromonospora purpureochromogenes TaxID=47872 RepID=UPI00362A59A5